MRSRKRKLVLLCSAHVYMQQRHSTWSQCKPPHVNTVPPDPFSPLGPDQAQVHGRILNSGYRWLGEAQASLPSRSGSYQCLEPCADVKTFVNVCPNCVRRRSGSCMLATQKRIAYEPPSSRVRLVHHLTRMQLDAFKRFWRWLSSLRCGPGSTPSERENVSAGQGRVSARHGDPVDRQSEYRDKDCL